LSVCLQQAPLFVRRDPSIALCFDFRFDLHAESMEGRRGEDLRCATAAPVDCVAENAERPIDGSDRSAFAVLVLEILDCFCPL